MPKSEERFIRVNGRDDWFSGITHAVRSRYVLAHKGEDKAVAKEKEIARRLYDTVRDTLKAAVGEAKAEHKKVTKNRIPSVHQGGIWKQCFDGEFEHAIFHGTNR